MADYRVDKQKGQAFIMNKDKQMQLWIRKQKQFIRTANTWERFWMFGAWAGYLNGLRLTNVLTRQEYKQYYDELMEYVNEVEAAKAA